MRSLFGDVRMRSLLGMLRVRSLFGVVEVRSLFGMWECDRFWDVGDVGMQSLFWGCGDAIKKLNFLI
jgi:hypothetical protein